MVSLAKFAEIAASYANLADFYLVYIQEAHPIESQHFDGIVEVPTHKNLRDRIQAAKYLMEEESRFLDNVNVVVDNMNNDGCREYASLPERAYLIHQDKVAVEGYLDPFYHMKSLRKIEKWLKKFASKSAISQVEGY